MNNSESNLFYASSTEHSGLLFLRYQINSPQAPGSAVRNRFTCQKHLCAGSEPGFCLCLSLSKAKKRHQLNWWEHIKIYHKSGNTHINNDSHIDVSLALNAGKDLLFVYSGLVTQSEETGVVMYMAVYSQVSTDFSIPKMSELNFVAQYFQNYFSLKVGSRFL